MTETELNKSYYSLGNYENSLKHGRWIYFYPDGQVYAKGHYKKGKKKGRWTYGGYTVRYPGSWKVTDKVSLDDKGMICIRDTIKQGTKTYYSINGGVEAIVEIPVRYMED